jgi:hypothetical protein
VLDADTQLVLTEERGQFTFFVYWRYETPRSLSASQNDYKFSCRPPLYHVTCYIHVTHKIDMLLFHNVTLFLCFHVCSGLRWKVLVCYMKFIKLSQAVKGLPTATFVFMNSDLCIVRAVAFSGSLYDGYSLHMFISTFKVTHFCF